MSEGARHLEAWGPSSVNHSGGLADVPSGYWLLKAPWHLLGMNVVAPFGGFCLALIASPNFPGGQGLRDWGVPGRWLRD